MSLGTQCKPWPNLKTPIPRKTYLLLQHLLRFLVKSEAATPATPPQSPISLILPIPQTPTQLPSESSGDTRSGSTANGILTPGAPPFSLAFPSLPLVGSSRAPILSPLDRMTLLHALPHLLLPMTAMLAADGWVWFLLLWFNVTYWFGSSFWVLLIRFGFVELFHIWLIILGTCLDFVIALNWLSILLYYF